MRCKYYMNHDSNQSSMCDNQKYERYYSFDQKDQNSCSCQQVQQPTCCNCSCKQNQQPTCCNCSCKQNQQPTCCNCSCKQNQQPTCPCKQNPPQPCPAPHPPCPPPCPPKPCLTPRPPYNPPTPGGYSPFRVPTSEEIATFNNAIGSLVGVTYQPLLVSTQIVNGTNYLFIALATSSTPTTSQYYVTVQIFVSTSGIITLGQITPIYR